MKATAGLLLFIEDGILYMMCTILYIFVLYYSSPNSEEIEGCRDFMILIQCRPFQSLITRQLLSG